LAGCRSRLRGENVTSTNAAMDGKNGKKISPVLLQLCHEHNPNFPQAILGAIALTLFAWLPSVNIK